MLSLKCKGIPKVLYKLQYDTSKEVVFLTANNKMYSAGSLLDKYICCDFIELYLI